jgi:hypothetical protein
MAQAVSGSERCLKAVAVVYTNDERPLVLLLLFDAVEPLLNPSVRGVGDLRVAGKGTEGAGLPGLRVFLSVQTVAGWVSLVLWPHKRYVAVRRNLWCIVSYLACLHVLRAFWRSQYL